MGSRNFGWVAVGLFFAVRMTFALDVVVNVAGTGASGYSGDGGPATSAKLRSPGLMAEDSAGNIYFCDSGNNVVRRIDAATQIITTVAGNGTSGFSGDNGPAISAQLRSPIGIVLDGQGNYYITDQGNARVRKIDKNGIITTFAGNGNSGYSGDGGQATQATVFTPASITIDPVTTNGNHAVVFSQLNVSVVRRVDPATNIITTICGTGSSGFSGDGGKATLAQLDEPAGISYDAAGNLVIPDASNERIRKITRSTGNISTIAGTGATGFAGDNGPALSAKFFMSNSPTIGGGMALDSNGNIFLTDTFNQRIRYIDATTGIITTIAGSGTAGYNGDVVSALSAQFNTAGGVLVEPNGNYLISDGGNNLIRRVIRNSQTLQFAVKSITPATGGNVGLVSPLVIGSGFKDGAKVMLQSAGLPTLTASSVINRLGLALQATFDLTGAATGVYDVVVTNPDNTSRTLARGFTIAAATPPAISAAMIGPSKIRGGVPQTYCVFVSNQSNTDVHNVEVQVSLPDFVTDVALVTPASRASLDSLLLNDSTLLADGFPLSPTDSGSILDLVMPLVPAGGSSTITLRVTTSDEFKFAHHIGEFSATAFYSQTDYDNASVGFNPASFKSRAEPAGRTAAQVCCVKNVMKNAVDMTKLDSYTKKVIKEDIDNAKLEQIANIPADSKADPCHNKAMILAKLYIIVKAQYAAQLPQGAFRDAVYKAVDNSLKSKSSSSSGSGCATTKTRSGGSSCSDGQSSSDSVSTESIVSHDPNDKSGPSGPGDAHYVARGTPMTYLVECENDKAATASVQKLVIADVLDTNLDLTTLNLGPIVLAVQVVEVPPGQNSLTTDLDLRPAKNLIVHIVAGLQNGNTLTWTCTALDPATMQPTTDPTLGFLDPDVTPPQGMGTFLYTINQKPGLAVGTTISNTATITFDANSPINTPTWTNTIALLGTDTDGDGFPDELEIAAGSDPANPNSTPLGPGTFPLQDLTVTKLQVKLDFTGKKADSLQLSGTFPAVPAGFVFNGQVAQVFVGGIYKSFTLDNKGVSPKSKTESFVIKQAKSLSAFTAKINGKLAAKLADKGFDGSLDLKAPKFANRSIQVYVLFNKGFYGEKAPVIFGSKLNTSGSLKLGK